LAALLRQERRTAVFVTHNLDEAARLSPLMGVIVEGVLRQVGTSKQIKSQPADEAVAAFLHELPQ
jgi:ABC-type proline/glycine betaine transport system ATPase subunit